MPDAAFIAAAPEARGATRYAILASPIGDLLLTADASGLTGLYMTPHKDRPAKTAAWVRDERALAPAASQMKAYFAGELTAFHLKLAPVGTDFQLRVWRALLDIPYGETTTYGALARRLGNANASRAVGLANGQNPISIVVPCHRVVGSDGSLTGYGGGLDRKRFLLEHEAKHAFRLRP